MLPPQVSKMRITNIRNMSSHWRLLAEPILTAPLHIVGILSDRATPFGSSSFFNNFASSPGPYSTHPPHGIGAPAVVASQSLGSATAGGEGPPSSANAAKTTPRRGTTPRARNAGRCSARLSCGALADAWLQDQDGGQ